MVDHPPPDATQATPIDDGLWRVLFDEMPQLGWTARPDGYIDHYNRGWFAFTGKTPAEMEGWGWKSVHRPDHIDRVEAEWRAAIAAARPFEDEFPLRRFDGVYRWFLTRARPVFGADGAVVRWVGINTDVDDQRAAHAAADVARRALTVQRALYERVFAEAPISIALFMGPRRVIELANDETCALWGRRADEVVGRPLFEAVPEVAGQGFEAMLDRVRETGEPFVGDEVPMQLPDGRGGVLTRYRNFVCQRFQVGDGVDGADGGVGAMTIGIDVTQQVQARARLVEAARLSRFAADIGAALTDQAPLPHQLARCCDAMLTLGGSSAGIWLIGDGIDVLELKARAERPGAAIALPEVAHVDKGDVGPSGDVGATAAGRQPRFRNAVGVDGPGAWAGQPLLVEDRVVGVMGMYGDAPFQDDVLQSLASVATAVALAVERDRGERFRELFIGMLGHDLRSPLSAILVGAETLMVSDVERTRRVAARIGSSGQRMSRMITQLLDYTRARSTTGVPLVRRRADLFAVVDDVVGEFLQAHPGRAIHIERSGDGDGDGAWDVDRMSQVFSNLIGNAIAYGDAAHPIRVTLAREGALLRATIENSGAAIPDDVLPHLFEPFRRARRAEDGGLGLGLFITRAIVQSHGGTITASSSGATTAFTVALPDGVRALAARPDEPRGGAGRS